jgi:Spy/CpxP family protein refolding chaperone
MRFVDAQLELGRLRDRRRAVCFELGLATLAHGPVDRAAIEADQNEAGEQRQSAREQQDERDRAVGEG